MTTGTTSTSASAEEAALLAEALGDVFTAAGSPTLARATDRDAQRGLWQELERLGFTHVSLPEAAGGTGGTVYDAALVAYTAAHHGVSLPLGDTALLAGWALAECGARVPAGMLTLAAAWTGVPGTGHGDLSVEELDDGWRMSGRLRAVPAGRHADAVVVLTDLPRPMLLLVPARECAVEPGENLGGEPVDELTVEGLRVNAAFPLPASVTPETVRERQALIASLKLAGGLRRVCELSMVYAGQRVQFGKPIAKFQVIRQYLAELAGESAAASAAVSLAVQAIADGDGPRATPQIAAAKICCGRAVETVTRLAHQIHGAIGFTLEHELHVHTRRLWAWRDEGGAEDTWAEVLGRLTAATRTPYWRPS